MKEIEDRPEPARMRGGRAATSGAELSAAVEGDPLLIEMARALHSHLPEDQRPVARMDFSDDQWARLEAAAAVIRAPLADLLAQGWKSGDRRVSPVLLEKSMGQAFIWVVWAVKPGEVRLLAVCSDERRADHYAANLPPGLTGFRSWKERAPLDHAFGFADSMHARVQGKL